MNHKYSTIILIFFITVAIAFGIVASFSSEDMDEVCNINGTVPYKNPTTGKWGCGSLEDTITYTTIINVTEIYNNYTKEANNTQFLRGLTPSELGNSSWNESRGNEIYASDADVLGNKTTITSQNKGFVYINNSGSAVSNNKTYRIDDTTALSSINLNATTFQIGGQTVQIHPFIGTSSGGCSYTYPEKYLRCSGGRFQDEIQVGYYVSITTCGDNRIKARVSTITNQTELVLANNNLGNGCGNSFSDVNGKPLINPSVQVKGSDGTLIGQFVEYYDATPALHQELEYYQDYNVEAGKSVKFKTNGYINFGTDDSAGQGYIQHASTTHIKLTNSDETEFYRTITFLSDASGGATKYQTIRGSDNGGTTNGAGTEWLQYAGKSRGTGVAGFRWYASSPLGSGTDLQSWNQVLYLIHNKLQLNVTLNGTGFNGERNSIVGFQNISTDKMALGSNTLDGLASGDINVSTVWYDTLTAKSPIIICSQNEGWKSCEIKIPEQQKTFWANFYNNWTLINASDGSKTITYNQLPAKIQEKVQKLVNKYLYDIEVLNTNQARDTCFKANAGNEFINNQCVHSPKKECESISYQYWDGSQCKINKRLQCQTIPLKLWDTKALSCIDNKVAICEKDGVHMWDSENQSCVFVNELQLAKQQSECESDRSKIWNGNTCISANSLA